jgi:hypothetical protein
MKIRPVGAKLSHADEQTDMTKLIVAFRNLANAPKKSLNFPEHSRRFWKFLLIKETLTSESEPVAQ